MQRLILEFTSKNLDCVARPEKGEEKVEYGGEGSTKNEFLEIWGNLARKRSRSGPDVSISSKKAKNGPTRK